jgi:hypothetical protein
MNLIVKKAISLTEEEKISLGVVGIPDNWPVETYPYLDTVPAGYELMSEENLVILKQDNQAAFDIWLFDPEVFEQNKKRKIIAIDTRTDQLIKQGFAFDGQQFSLSLNAQVNWLGLKTLEAVMTWPVNVATLNSDQYSLAQANLIPFVGTAAATVQARLDSGRTLKVSLNNATTQAELDAVLDNR